MTREQVQAWLDAYVDAWRTYEASTIGALFSADATYAYHPYDEPERGREAIVASWLSEPDGRARGRRATRRSCRRRSRRRDGETVYADGRRFSNLFVLRFDGDGRCSEFVEWYIETRGR